MQKEIGPFITIHAIIPMHFPRSQNKTGLEFACQQSLFPFHPADICVLCSVTSGHTWAMLAGLYKSRCCVNHFALLTSKTGRQAEQCRCSLPGIWQGKENKCISDICSCSLQLSYTNQADLTRHNGNY